MNLAFYWALLMRRLPVMLAFLLICSGVGLVAALKLPPTWTTSAQLLIEDPQITTGGGDQPEAAEQLQVIEQRLMTRANLIDIAHKFRVFPDLATLSPDRIVADMRAATAIRRQAGRDRATLMTISFEADGAQTAANVVNEFVTLVLDVNSKERMSRVEGTLSFFEQEVQRLSDDLDAQSARIVAFKTANAAALPEDQQYRLGRQTLLQERLGRLESDRAALVALRADIVARFQATGEIQGAPGAQLTADQQRLKALQLELEQARAIYSDSNPKLLMIQSQIDQLEAALAAQSPAVDEAGAPQSMLDVTLAEMDSRLKALDRDIETATADLAQLEAAIAAASSIAIALAALERDYANIQGRYTAAVNNLNQARMGERIETSAQGQRITVLEGAAVPQEPSGPDRRKIAGLGIGSGLGLAVGWFLLLELLNRSIRQPGEMKSRFGIVPIVSIPYMESRRERMARRGALVAASLAVLIGVPAGLWYVDTNYMPLELLADKVITRLGLS